MRNRILSRLIILILLLNIAGFSGCAFVIDSFESGINSVKRVFHSNRTGKLDDKEYKWAKIAWQYFDNNYNKNTGLVNGKNGYQIATLWNMSDNIMALMAAYDLKIISEHEFEGKLSNQLKFLSNMQLCSNLLPNRTYNTITGLMVDYSRNPGESGWDAVDIGRMLIVLKVLAQKHSQNNEFIDKIVLRWDLCSAVDSDGNLLSSSKWNNSISAYQDGYIGTKEYISRGFQAWGYNVKKTAKFENFNKEIIFNKVLFVDGRDERLTKSINSLVSSHYLLDRIEFDNQNFGSNKEIDYLEIDDRYKIQTENIFKIQKMRFEIDKVLTARNTYQSNSEPYIIYNTIFGNGYSWNILDPNGKYLKNKALISTQSVFSMWVLWDDYYTDELMNFMKNAFDPLSGWYEGRYESSSSFETTIVCSTNAVILESLWFKTNGRLYEQTDINNSYYLKSFTSELSNKTGCIGKIRKISK